MKLRSQSLIFLMLGLLCLGITASLITVQFNKTRNLASAVQDHQQALVLVNNYQFSANNLVLCSIELIRSGDISGDRIVSYKMAAATLERDIKALGRITEKAPVYHKEVEEMRILGQNLSKLCKERLIKPLYNHKNVEQAMIDRLIYTELNGILRSCNFTKININETLKDLDDRQKKSNLTIAHIYLPIIIGSISILLSLSVLLVFRITGAVNKTHGYMKKLATGSSTLDITLPVRGNNEISLLCNNFNLLMSNLKERSISMNSIAGDHLESGSHLMNVTETHGSALMQIEKNLEGMNEICSGMTRKVSASSQEISRITEALDHLENESGEQEKQTVTIHHQGEAILAALSSQREAMKEQVQLTHKVQKEGEQNQEILILLKKQINDIILESSTLSQSVLDIQDLSEQTDLLAVNASIQAAHAGEFGKRFSVVTHEMHRLSAKVRTITTSLTDLIKNLQHRLSLMEEEEQQNQDSIKRLMDQNSRAEESVTLIHRTMEDMENRVTGFMEALKEIRDGSTLIHFQTNQVRESGNELTCNMKDLEENQSSIREELKEITQGIRQLNNGTLTLKELSRKNQKSAHALGTEIKLMGG